MVVLNSMLLRKHFMILSKKLDYIDSDIVQELYRKKDKKVCELVDDNAHYIAIAINNIIMFYDPDVIVINGSYYRKLPELLKIINDDLKSKIAEPVLIRNTSLENDAIILGCIAYSAQNTLNITSLKFCQSNKEKRTSR